MDSREFLTGCALIALAIDRGSGQTSGDMAAIMRAINRLSRHEDGRNLERHKNEQAALAFEAMAVAAVGLADACFIELYAEDRQDG